MFDYLIRFSLQNRFLIIVLAALTVTYGYKIIPTLPLDVFPDLNRPTVTVITESHGLAPEEVETLVTFPIESVMNGANGVIRVRSSSLIGFSVIYVEFDWDFDIFLARQIVTEKLNQVIDFLPENVNPVMGPISSIMGEIMFLGMTSNDEKIEAMQLRTIADWNVKQKLLGLDGVSKITVIGGDIKQYHILVDPQKLLNHNITIHQVYDALKTTNENTTGGFIVDPYTEYAIRNLGRIIDIDELKKTVIPKKVSSSLPALTISDVADVKISGSINKRGDASINGQPGVLLAISKQLGKDTINLTKRIEDELKLIKQTLPNGIELNSEIFKQSDFINNAIDNISEALIDGSILVAIILFLFLFNLRITMITLLAIPLSFITTFIIFKFFDLSINTMTLGGLAIAIGELVDDAIVDVENIFRRLKENNQKQNPLPSLKVVFNASKEIRNSIVFATFIVILVFIPLFSLGGLEGKIFIPLGLAYITSIISSLIISLTLTPTLSSLLLSKINIKQKRNDPLIVFLIKKIHGFFLKIFFSIPKTSIFIALALFVFSMTLIPKLGGDFLPEFNEGSFTINVALAPGTSLDESNRISILAEKLIHEIPEVLHTARRTGRAENDEHALGVNTTELEVSLNLKNKSKDKIENEIREKLGSIPGVVVNVGQPISHRIDFITSGVRSQIVLKVFGNDLQILREQAFKIQELIKNVEGLTDLQIEQQLLIPQVHINFDRDKAKQHGIMIGEAAKHAQLALNGEVVTTVIQGNQLIDVVLRLNDNSKENMESIGKIPFETYRGNTVPLNFFADIENAKGPNQINRENLSRRIVIQANSEKRDIVSIVSDIKKILDEKLLLPKGYYLKYDGQFKSQSKAKRDILILSIFSILGIFAALLLHFRSLNFTIQVLLVIPLSYVGAIVGIYLTNGVVSIASLVGFITLTGIASRNGILMISHYLYLVKNENEIFDYRMIKRGTQERLVPVLMTALTAIFALTPLVFSHGQAGKEILQPVATVIFSGLITSTLFNLIFTPIVFFNYGKNATIKYLKDKENKI